MWKETCPAKLNLYLAVTGPREDGYHELVSLVVQTGLCDELEAELAPLFATNDSLVCDDATLPVGADNLVLKAAAAYRERVPTAPFLHFRLKKRIPYGAGLGGGSSDAVQALRILNAASRDVLDRASLQEVAAKVGSDCPLFLMDGPVLMRGRGELLEPLQEPAKSRLRGQSVMIVKPHFSIGTAWAYSALKPANAYIGKAEAEADLRRWLQDGSPEELPLRNSFQTVVYRKYPCYDVLNAQLARAGCPELVLTGSGSAAFAFCDGTQAERMKAIVQESLGNSCFLTHCSLQA